MVAIKLSHSLSTSPTNTPVATLSAPTFPERNIKENYIVVNFMVTVRSKRNIVILRRRLNSYMSLLITKQ